MARTTAAAVSNILDNTQLSNTIIDAYITTANLMVTDVLGTTLSAALLAEIEMWLTAHMIASTRERQAKKEGAGGAEIEYTGKYAYGLQMTSYGQMVLLLDSTGEFAKTQDLADEGKKSAWIRAIQNFE